MKHTLIKLFLLFLILIPISIFSQKDENKEEIVDFPEEDPQFPGGMKAFSHFIADNIKYPEKALDKGIEGKCMIEFIVERDGTVSHVKIVRKVKRCRSCNKEAVRVVKMMPKWKPGTVSGTPIRCRFRVPINYKLAD